MKQEEQEGREKGAASPCAPASSPSPSSSWGLVSRVISTIGYWTSNGGGQNPGMAGTPLVGSPQGSYTPCRYCPLTICHKEGAGEREPTFPGG